MARLCERPGCSAPASVAYGMDGAELLVWLERVPDDGPVERMGVVCRRHADAMVVPRGWTLDDRRESRPRLFRVSDSPAARAKPTRQRRKVQASDTEQLSLSMTGEDLLGVDPSATSPVGTRSTDEDLDDAIAVDEITADEITVGEIRPLAAPDADETRAIPWRFEFDERDDLDGLLRVDSPLLSRAFRGRQREA